MSLKTRKVKTSSGKIAVQIVEYSNYKRKIVEHLGTAQSEQHLITLLGLADKRILELNAQAILFDCSPYAESRSKFSEQYQLGDHLHNLLYEELSYVYKNLGFDLINDPMLKDLAIARILKPASKASTVEILAKHFHIKHSLNSIYKQFKLLQRHKPTVEKAVVLYAVENLHQNVSVLFYDVTTLYFETFTADELRQCGFSKDNKFNQPQIVVALIMTDIGFPVSYQLYNGKKFEGHTMLPSIDQFCKDNSISKMTVVADAAMISKDNVYLLKENGYKYIVGARLGNLKQSYLDLIYSANKQIDRQTFTIPTELGRLIVSYSGNRYSKDLKELEKQCRKAEFLLRNPAKITSKNLLIQKSKVNRYQLNTSLLEKRKKLLGLKGYYTNTVLSSEEVIRHYSNLWKIEKNFRIFKNDMQVRPVFHWKPATIQSHLLVCFMALCISKLIELKTQISIQQYVNRMLEVTDTEVHSWETGETFLVRNQYDRKQIDELMRVIHN